MRLPDRKHACHWLTIGHGKWDYCWEKNVVTGVTHFLLIMEWDVMRLQNWNKWSATHFLLVLRLLMMRLPSRKGLTPWYEVWWDCLAENWVQRLTPFFNRMRCDKTGWHKCFSFTHFLWVIEQDFNEILAAWEKWQPHSHTIGHEMSAVRLLVQCRNCSATHWLLAMELHVMRLPHRKNCVSLTYYWPHGVTW